jgi:hypothetical protein
MFKIENNKIQVFIKNVYGQEVVYVKDDKIATLIQRLTGRKTLTKWDIDTLKAWGFEFEIVAERSSL